MLSSDKRLLWTELPKKEIVKHEYLIFLLKIDKIQEKNIKFGQTACHTFDSVAAANISLTHVNIKKWHSAYLSCTIIHRCRTSTLCR